MRRVRATASTLSTASCLIYLLFSWSEIQSLFTTPAVIMIKQIMVGVFCVAVFASPRAVIESAHGLAPKIIEVVNAVYTALFTSKKKNDGSQTD